LKISEDNCLTTANLIFQFQFYFFAMIDAVLELEDGSVYNGKSRSAFPTVSGEVGKSNGLEKNTQKKK
jgi:hypothetical protein